MPRTGTTLIWAVVSRAHEVAGAAGLVPVLPAFLALLEAAAVLGASGVGCGSAGRARWQVRGLAACRPRHRGRALSKAHPVHPKWKTVLGLEDVVGWSRLSGSVWRERHCTV